ncbi:MULTISPECIES: queuosine precursor transporter [unclassified Sporosarcina]|uniref:queuosine precursor transporter n=1 Tax=unclassified Sporosarcina TaxID=2647733 RepID=UPI00203C03DC|nr:MULTISPECIES: queuosine precursor transporter [unclassified Sporosarcina]GKV66436.1 transporter [Sporosarcina sp. NCCP-2331]GLB56700.1 transporter [Sporosarcina sp. NCCP-2378]
MRYYLSGTFVGLLILSNILAVKLVSLGSWIVLPAAAVVYVCTYPILDVLTETYGKEAARQTVFTGLFVQLLSTFFIWLAINLPAAPFYEEQQAFETIFSAGFRVTLASLAAYVVSQNLDVTIFHKLKEKHGEKKLWIRNNASTMASQLVDTVIFIVIAFYGTMPFTALLGLIAAQYVFKFAVAVIDTPVVYMLVAICRKIEAKKNHKPDSQTDASSIVTTQ